MKTTKSPCKITGLDVTEIRIAGSALAAECVFVGGEGKARYGAAYRGDPVWPKEVLEAARELRDQIERHLMSVYFENGGLDDNATAADSSGQRELAFPPKGLGEVELGGPEDEPGQV